MGENTIPIRYARDLSDHQFMTDSQPLWITITHKLKNIRVISVIIMTDTQR